MKCRVDRSVGQSNGEGASRSKSGRQAEREKKNVNEKMNERVERASSFPAPLETTSRYCHPPTPLAMIFTSSPSFRVAAAIDAVTSSTFSSLTPSVILCVVNSGTFHTKRRRGGVQRRQLELKGIAVGY